MVNLVIDGIKVSVPENYTILKAAQLAGINIPTLCSYEDLAAKGNCGICQVEIVGEADLKKACTEPVKENLVIMTNSINAQKAKREALDKILSRHPAECLTCARNQNCELQEAAATFGVRSVIPETIRDLSLDTSTPSLIRDPRKCIGCMRCVDVCTNIQTVGALVEEGDYSFTIDHKPLIETKCVMCGQCALVCPVGAITEKEEIDRFLAAVADPSKIVVTQIAPAVRVAVAEELGLPTGSLDMLKFVAALRQVGFDRVFHTNFTADLTIMEEGNELLERLQHGGQLPMITSCSPGWINFIETFYPDLLGHLSTCKSPQQMFGALVKTYYPQKVGIDPANIFSVSIMPCTAKKFEAQRPEMKDSGYQDVDLVLTTRELGKLFKQCGVKFAALKDDKFDSWLGEYTGAAVIFGTTGGVMEAALRTVYEVVTKQTLENVDFLPCRGLEGIKEASVDLNGLTVKVAIAHTLGNARKLLDLIREGKADYHFIEVMCCPGGCIGGGGQPIPTTMAKRQERIDAIYAEDAGLPKRKSHENEEVLVLYKEFLEKPLGHKSHELLHTHYHPTNK